MANNNFDNPNLTNKTICLLNSCGRRAVGQRPGPGPACARDPDQRHRSRAPERAADTALRLERFFGASAEFWMQLQTSFDLSKTRAEKQDEIQRFIAPRTGGDETKETEGED